MIDRQYIPVELGDKIRFIPAAWTEKSSEPQQKRKDRTIRDVLGIVEHINVAHRFYRVRYEAAGTVQHECFKF